jgi:hypothetical protein
VLSDWALRKDFGLMNINRLRSTGYQFIADSEVFEIEIGGRLGAKPGEPDIETAVQLFAPRFQTAWLQGAKA